MKTAAALVLLWVTPLAWSQNTTVAQQAPAKTAPASAQTEAPAKAQEQTSKTAVKINPEKEAAIRKLFEIQGTKKSMEQVFAGMRENMKPNLAKMLPPGEYQDKLIPLFFEKFQTKLKTEDLLDLIVPIYDKYLSKEDIEGLAQFYQTPVGKKIEFCPASINGRDPNDSDEHGTGARAPSHDRSARGAPGTAKGIAGREHTKELEVQCHVESN